MTRISSHYYKELLNTFLILKLLIFLLAHVSVLTVIENDSGADIIVFYSRDLNYFDWFLKVLIKPLIRWDAIHMLAIAKYGYVFENQFAFFPLLPMLSRNLGLFMSEYFNLKKFISIEPLMAIIGVFFSNVCHLLATFVLFKLTFTLFKSIKFARITSLLFLLNPATVQLSTMYTEAPFALFTFVGLFAFYKNHHFAASISWSLASATRSNGIVLIGFFFYDLFLTLTSKQKCLRCIIAKFLKTLIYSAISVLTFVAFQYYAYIVFCVNVGELRPWCSSRLPNIYSFVQKEYWNVGLFNYYTLNNIPNFLFALPMIIICGSACFMYFEYDHLRFLSIGLLRSKIIATKKAYYFYNDLVLPHIYLLIFMLFYNVFVAHVQIITRVFTFMPVVYWFMAFLVIYSSEFIKKSLLTYTGLYGLIGTVLFSLNYPPA